LQAEAEKKEEEDDVVHSIVRPSKRARLHGPPSQDDDAHIEINLANADAPDEPGTDDDGADEDEGVQGAGAVGEKEVQAAISKPARTRRTKQELEPWDVDVGLRMREVFIKLQPLRQILEALEKAEDYKPAVAVRSQILEVAQELSSLPVCPGCLVEFPSKRCRDRGLESWKYVSKIVLCGYCKPSALTDFTKRHFQESAESLRRRVRAEVEMVLAADEVEKPEDLKKALTALNITYGRGSGPRTESRKRPGENTAWLIGQLYRSADRLAFEPTLHKERLVLLQSLRRLGAR
jgi:hypothetical protein